VGPGLQSQVAAALNNNGEVAGISEPSGAAVLWKPSPKGYTATSLNASLTPAGINDSDQIAANGQVGGANHPFLWQPGKGATDLGTLGGGAGESDYAVGINAAGHLAGYQVPLSCPGAPGCPGGGGESSRPRGTDLDLLSCGGASSGCAPCDTGWAPGSHGDVWRWAGAFGDLGSLDPTPCANLAGAINSSDQVAGWGYNNEPVPGNPGHEPCCTWQAAVYVAGPAARGLSGGGTDSEALGINDSGQTVGWCCNPYGATSFPAWQAALWSTAGAVTPLPLLPSCTGLPCESEQAVAINPDGTQIAGYQQGGPSDSDALIWQLNGGSWTVTDLNALIPSNSGWQLGLAQAINAGGQIAGMGTYNGQYTAFLLSPSVAVWSVQFDPKLDPPVVRDCDTTPAGPPAAPSCGIAGPASGDQTVKEFQGAGCPAAADNPAPSAEWQDCGQPPTGTPGKRWPVMAVKQTQLTVKEVRFRAPAGLFKNPIISAQVELPGQGTFTLGPVRGRVKADELIATDLTSTDALPASVMVLDPVTINWSVQEQSTAQPPGKAAAPGSPAGASTHRIYVMNATALTQQMEVRGTDEGIQTGSLDVRPFLTLVDFSVNSAAGADNDDAVFKSIWNGFPSKTIYREDLDPATGAVSAGQLLHYYDPRGWSLPIDYAGYADGSPYGYGCVTLEGLLSSTEGRCGDWAEFLAAEAGLQGLTADVYKVDAEPGWAGVPKPYFPSSNGEYMLIGRAQWQFSGPASGDSSFPFEDRFCVAGAMTLKFDTGLDQFEYKTNSATLVGQSNAAPPGWFTVGDHAVVNYHDRIYDPSYGNGSYANVLEWAQSSIAGFAYQKRALSLAGKSCWLLAAHQGLGP